VEGFIKNHITHLLLIEPNHWIGLRMQSDISYFLSGEKAEHEYSS